MHKLQQLSRREREVVDIVFRAGRATVAEVRECMTDPPSYSAVRATLGILERKGLLRHEDEGRRYVYRLAVKRETAARVAVEHLVKTFFAGSAAATVLAVLGRSDLDISQEDSDRIAELIERAREEGR